MAWTAWDLSRVTSPGWDVTFFVLLALAVSSFLLGQVRWGAGLRSLGLGLLGATYYGAHIVDLGVQVVPAVGYLTALIVQIELRSLSDRFAPIYERQLALPASRRVDEALVRAGLRLALASALAIFVPIFAADMALSRLVPLTSIPTAILLAAALVAVIALLALLPILERRAPMQVSPEGATQKPN